MFFDTGSITRNQVSSSLQVQVNGPCRQGVGKYNVSHCHHTPLLAMQSFVFVFVHFIINLWLLRPVSPAVLWSRFQKWCARSTPTVIDSSAVYVEAALANDMIYKDHSHFSDFTAVIWARKIALGSAILAVASAFGYFSLQTAYTVVKKQAF